jgi:hypothetical protein
LNETSVGELPPCDGEHAIAGFDTGDARISAKHLASGDGHQTGATGHIEELHARLEAVAALSGFAIDMTSAPKTPANNWVVVFRCVVEKLFDVNRTLLRCGITLGENRMGGHGLFKHS